MSLSSPFIARPVATTLLTVGVALAGMLAFFKLPVSPLPQIDFATISVTAQLPGASPDTVATSLAAPLERRLGAIADVSEMTSQSSLGQARITLQFNIDRDIDGAARDVQAAINAARADLPTNLPSNPTYRKYNPADAPILILALTSKTMSRGQIFDVASNVLQQRLSQLDGVGQVVIGGSNSARRARRTQPDRAVQIWNKSRGCPRGPRFGQCEQPERHDRTEQRALPDLHQRPGQSCRRLFAARHRLPQRRGRAPI